MSNKSGIREKENQIAKAAASVQAQVTMKLKIYQVPLQSFKAKVANIRVFTVLLLKDPLPSKVQIKI